MKREASIGEKGKEITYKKKDEQKRGKNSIEKDLTKGVKGGGF